MSVGPDVLCVRNGNTVKFMNMQTKAVSYFKAETVNTGLNIGSFTGHNRFPLFAFSEVTLRPSIYIYRYPDMTKFATIPRKWPREILVHYNGIIHPNLTAHSLSYSDIRFTEFDQLICIGSYPEYTLYVYNYRTATLIVEQQTMVPSVNRSLVVSFNSLPSMVIFHKREMTILCYEIFTIEKESFLHKVSEVEVSKDYIKSCDQFLSFGDDNNLYATNDFGHLVLVDVACFALKPQWQPTSTSNCELVEIHRPHSLTCHRSGFLIANSTNAFYVKKKSGAFQVTTTP